MVGNAFYGISITLFCFFGGITMEDKLEARKHGKYILSRFSKEELEKRSLTIASFVFETSWWQKATVIGITISQPFEINTSFIINRAWKEQKVVAVPKCYPKDNHRMEFFQITDYNQLEKGYANIMEPDVHKTSVIKKEAIDLLFVPGLLFDQDGYRIGFGGGYYDRYLSNFKQTTISLANTEQLVKMLPKEPYDLPVEHLVTEKGVLF